MLLQDLVLPAADWSPVWLVVASSGGAAGAKRDQAQVLDLLKPVALPGVSTVVTRSDHKQHNVVGISEDVFAGLARTVDLLRGTSQSGFEHRVVTMEELRAAIDHILGKTSLATMSTISGTSVTMSTGTIAGVSAMSDVRDATGEGEGEGGGGDGGFAGSVVAGAGPEVMAVTPIIELVRSIFRQAGVVEEVFASPRTLAWIVDVAQHRDAMYCVTFLVEGAVRRWAEASDRDPIVADIPSLRLFTDAALLPFMRFASSVEGHFDVLGCVLRWVQWAEERVQQRRPFPFGSPAALSGGDYWAAAPGPGIPAALVGRVFNCLVPNVGVDLPIDRLATVTAEHLGLLRAEARTYLYHGTTHDSAASIARTEIRLENCRHIGTDFGLAFYLGFDLRDAVQWAARACNAGLLPAVVVFTVPDTRALNASDADVEILRVDDGLWLPLVTFNHTPVDRRTAADGAAMRALHGNFSVIVGPQAKPGGDGRYNPPATRPFLQCALTKDSEASLWSRSIHAVVFYDDYDVFVRK